MRRRRRFSATLLASLFAAPALAQAPGAPPADCRTLVDRLGKLMAIYRAAASEDLKGQDLAVAMERARKEALAGKKEATIVMVGYSSLIYGRENSYPVTTIRQVCTFAERNGLPLHIVTCAYFHQLNPLGETEAKVGATRKLIARFEGLKEPPADLDENMSVLKACQSSP